MFTFAFIVSDCNCMTRYAGGMPFHFNNADCSHLGLMQVPFLVPLLPLSYDLYRYKMMIAID